VARRVHGAERHSDDEHDDPEGEGGHQREVAAHEVDGSGSPEALISDQRGGVCGQSLTPTQPHTVHLR